MSSTPAATADSEPIARFRHGGAGLSDLPQTLRALGAELGPSPQRWRRSARIALITGLGAGVTAALQIANPLGLTLLFNFAAPEMALSMSAAIRFLIGTAILQAIGLALAGAMVDSALPHLAIFTVLSLVSGYLIYADSRIGRLWVWAQVPVLTAFYLVIFDPDGFGWNAAEAFYGVAVAVALLYVANTLLWPQAADAVLAESLAHTLERSRQRLALLLDIWTGRCELQPAEDRPVASKLGYHLALLGPAAHHINAPDTPAALLAAVMVAERIHNEIERIAEMVAGHFAGAMSAEERAGLLQAASAIDSMLRRYGSGLAGLGSGGGARGRQGGRPAPPSPHPGSAPAAPQAAALRARTLLSHQEDGAAGDAGSPVLLMAARLHALSTLLEDASVPSPTVLWERASDRVPDALQPPTHTFTTSANSSPRLRHRPVLNRFLLRYTARHSTAMILAFIIGLFANNAAFRASLWLLMIGGPPSHGATVRKFTIRAIGAGSALLLAAGATIVLAPNSTTVFSYMMAIAAGAFVMAYVGQGGGLLSYLSIGGTAFVIAFSGAGPRNDALGSIWTIWGISFGMLLRAAVSIVWRERASRTLVEEFQAPLRAILQLLSRTGDVYPDAAAIREAEQELIEGIREMLGIASDAQLEGRSAGIDALNLVDALDSLRRVAFILGNRALLRRASAQGGDEDKALDAALRARFADWLESLHAQQGEGAPSLAPLRAMVAHCTAPDLNPWVASGGEDGQLAALVQMLEAQLARVSLH